MASSENVLAIDADNLDKEWIEQPERYYLYAYELAQARLRLQEAEQELDVTAAEVEQAIRADPVAYNLPKITEASVKACILMQAEYKIAQREVNAARHSVDLHQAMVTALDHRKRALEKLVDLWLGNYYAAPRESRVSGGAAQSQKRMDAKLAKAYKKADSE